MLTNGRIVGFLNDRGAHEWRGLPLVAPPVGEERWWAWRADEDEAAFLVFDAPADGGIRHSKKIESDVALLADIASDSRFDSECDRCEAMAGIVPGRLPDYDSLPRACGQFFSPGGVLDCSSE